MAQYGRTWWGEQWLNALENIDYSNRLGRGRSYANNDHVKDIRINENQVLAKVQGRQPKPYQINIVVPPFTENEQNRLVEIIQHNPLIITQLLNRQLPNELLDLANKSKIKIFPSSWHDIKLNCSCPDYAVPCKHLAAVIYMLANEIDQNPFLVFTLHRFNLTEKLSSLKGSIQIQETEKILRIEDCISTEHKSKTKSIPTVEPDFSIIEDLLPTLPILYSANPLFYKDGDFKSKIQSHYKRQSKFEPLYSQNLKKETTSLLSDYRYFSFALHFDQEISSQFIAEDQKGKSIPIPFDELLVLLAQTERKHLESYHPSFTAIYRIFRFCNIVCERGAFLPRLFKVNETEFQIQWIPAMINSSVRLILDQLIQRLPEAIVTAMHIKPGKKRVWIKSALSQQESMLHLCAQFIDHSIAVCYNGYNTGTQKRTSELDEKINALFFEDSIQSFDRFDEKEVPNTIALWLQRFSLNKKEYVPVLQIHEKKTGGFELEALVKNNAQAMQPIYPLSHFASHFKDHLLPILKDFQSLAMYMPDLNTIVSSKGAEKLSYSNNTFAEILLDVLPLIKLFDIQILLPKSLQQILYPKTTLKLKAKSSSKGFLTLDSLVDFDWRISIGDQFLTVEEFKRLSSASSRLVKIKDKYMMLSKNEIERIINKLKHPTQPNSIALIQAALSGDFEGTPVMIDALLKNRIDDILSIDTIPLPKTIQATLRPYQVRGYSWLYKNANLGLGSILADDMGLGKTLQVIATLQKFKDEGSLINKPAIVIAPTSLLSNWQREILKFAPDLNAFIYHGGNRKQEFKSIDVVITSYGTLRSDVDKLNKQTWYCQIIDEAQNIKNNETLQTKAIKKLKSITKIAMSGTPVENRLLEYWSILDFANPGYLGSSNWFSGEYANAIEINQDLKKLEKFKRITSPFIMRRVKTDKSIISDLPDKIENNQYCNLTKEQASLYDTVTKELLTVIEKEDGITRQGIVLKLLTLLKQICNHPAQYLKKQTIILPDHSGKMMMLLQLLETIYEINEKVLIFSQYKEMGDIISKVIYEHFGKKALQLDGSTTRKERDEMVQQFQHQSNHDTFMLSLKAGGTGLNLTAANHVIHYDLWWNPAVEAQATDRAFRIGQTKNVLVHRMITKGTLEEKIDDLIKSKKQLASLTVSTGEKWIGELNDHDLRELVALGKD